jgi:chondroitin AC lyase
MKKKILQHNICFLAIISAVFFIAADKVSEPSQQNPKQPAEEKTRKYPASQDLQLIKKRIVDDLQEPAINAGKINQLVKTMLPDGSWPGINYKDTTKTGFQHSIHLENMLNLARAYKKKDSEFYRNADVKKTVSSALDFWLAHDFICENWWWNEMGTPNWMINTLLVLDSDITQKQRIEGARIASRASLTGFGARAGGDFVPIAGMVCKQGLFKNDDSILQNAVKVMAAQITITPARGINPDFGFHHRTDNVTSIHTYGTNYVSAFAYWAVKTAGTKYSLSPESLTLLIDYYIDGISKCMAFGMYPDAGAKNRDLSRRGSLDPAGTEIPENFMQSSDYRKKELDYLVKVRKGAIKPDLTWNRYFWHSSYFAHQRIKYYASVRMYSSRQNNMEEPYNEEGLKNHHVADGSSFLSLTGREYVDVFPVWDWQKIPGTTVVQKPSLPPFKEIAKKGLSDFVGAVTDGEFGAAAFDFRSVHDPLKARKSWFFFDREYVCLGTAITAEAEYPVATTVNQCLLHYNVVVKSKNGLQTLGKGQHNLQDVSWVLHDSVAYLFPDPVTVNVSNTTAKGNWRQITHQASASGETVQKDLFTLWLDHGLKPRSASYAYIVVPSITLLTVDQYSKKTGIIVLANTPEIQAVQNINLHVSEVVFYQPGTIKLPGNINLTSKNPCIIMIKMAGNAMEKIAVSDPTQKLTSLELQVSIPVDVSGENYRSSWNKDSKLTKIEVDLPAGGNAGKTVIMETRKKNS